MATSKKIAAPTESTEELLIALNAAGQSKENVSTDPPGVVRLAAGTLKVIVTRPEARIENIDRARVSAGAGSFTPVPEYLVIEQRSDGKAAFYLAYSYAGAVEPLVSCYTGNGKLYDWIPERISSTSGMQRGDFLRNEDFNFHLHTTDALTVYQNREARKLAEPTPFRQVVNTTPHLEPLPEFGRHEFKTPGLAEAICAFEDFVAATHAGGRQVAAAHAARALNAATAALVVVDRSPIPPIPPRGELGYFLDGSSPVVQLGQSSNIPNGLHDAYIAMARVIGVHAVGTFHNSGERATCDSAAQSLMALRDIVRQL